MRSFLPKTLATQNDSRAVVHYVTRLLVAYSFAGSGTAVESLGT